MHFSLIWLYSLFSHIVRHSSLSSSSSLASFASHEFIIYWRMCNAYKHRAHVQSAHKFLWHKIGFGKRKEAKRNGKYIKTRDIGITLELRCIYQSITIFLDADWSIVALSCFISVCIGVWWWQCGVCAIAHIVLFLWAGERKKKNNRPTEKTTRNIYRFDKTNVGSNGFLLFKPDKFNCKVALTRCKRQIRAFRVNLFCYSIETFECAHRLEPDIVVLLNKQCCAWLVIFENCPFLI